MVSNTSLYSSSKSSNDPTSEFEVLRMLSSLGIDDYDPQVLSLLIDRTHMYAASLLYDAKDYSVHAGRSQIDISDIRMATEDRRFGLPTDALPREDLVQLANEVNRRPLPPVPNEFGVRLPPCELQQTADLFDILPGTEAMPVRQKAPNKDENDETVNVRGRNKPIASKKILVGKIGNLSKQPNDQ
eukprot:289573_1